ncbi:hypothetical protein [Leisingera sp. JC1]|uniref:hypothetical protein n=1 Tax=Leisingera sp. JC1 TaxID=1855282 RepID=UPI000802EA88|nr:hypothetical protein [Leisingera sp. JC1]
MLSGTERALNANGSLHLPNPKKILRVMTMQSKSWRIKMGLLISPTGMQHLTSTLSAAMDLSKHRHFDQRRRSALADRAPLYAHLV